MTGMIEKEIRENMKRVAKKYGVIVSLLLSATMTACATTKPLTCLETPETVIPYWIDGIIFVSSAMVEKNRYWLEKYKNGKATPDDLVRVLESNKRFHEGMVGRLEAAKECAALARQELIDAQEDDQ